MTYSAAPVIALRHPNLFCSPLGAQILHALPPRGPISLPAILPCFSPLSYSAAAGMSLPSPLSSLHRALINNRPTCSVGLTHRFIVIAIHLRRWRGPVLICLHTLISEHQEKAWVAPLLSPLSTPHAYRPSQNLTVLTRYSPSMAPSIHPATPVAPVSQILIFQNPPYPLHQHMMNTWCTLPPNPPGPHATHPHAVAPIRYTSALQQTQGGSDLAPSQSH